MTENRYIGNKAFYKMALTVALPIMAQNFVSSLVNVLDNLMVGALGTEQMSGVSIVNQLIFIFNLAIFGAMSGIGIFTAQFYGKKDNEGIRHTLRFKLLIAVMISAAALVVLSVFHDALIRLFLHGDASTAENLDLTLGFGKEYLWISLIGLAPFAISNVFADTMRQTGNTFFPMLTGFAAVGINCLFNYLLIFGKLFFPAMGVRGAAVATVLSRFCELGILITYILRHRKDIPYISGAFNSLRVPKERAKAFVVRGMPLFVNELLWSGGMSALSVAFSLHGLTVVAAYSISSTISNLFSMACLSMGVTIGIIAGQLLGAGKHNEAIDTVRKLTVFSVFAGFTVGIMLFFGGGLITHLYKTSEESKELARYFLRVFGCTMPLISFTNAAYFTLRSGGRTFVTFLFDSVFMWVVSVPTAFVLYYVFNLEIHLLFPAVQGLELLKCIVGYIMMKKRVWVKTIV